MRVLFAALCAWAMWAAPAAAQVLYFPADNYGRPNKSFTESASNQRVLEVLMGRTDVFETVYDFDTADPFRRIGRAVGMLDLLVRLPDGRQVNTTCTATLIAPNRAITNNHCIPGADFTTVRAQMRLGFLDRLRAPGETFNVRLPAIETNRALDYAIVEVVGVPTDRYPPLQFSTTAPRARQSLYVIHHPAGFPQRLTRVRCQSAEPAVQDSRLVHHCDTLGGSSGALVLSMENNRMVGLHFAGVPDTVRPHNYAVPATTLLNSSSELARLTRVATTAPPATTTATTSAAPAVNAATLYTQGMARYYGSGVPRDNAEAARLLRQAADQGHAGAQSHLGYMYRTGTGVTRDDTEAVRLFRLSAGQGYARGQFNLGAMYRDGLGVSQDHVEAVRLFRLATNQGLAAGQNGLGAAYQTGRGVPQDNAEALRLYRLAADQGLPNAQTNLGNMYEHGRGVTANRAEAVRLYRLAARQGETTAQEHLTRLGETW